ncbi:MAG: sigma-70 family RNA polymerase sigma factor [Sarcina sp.]
MSEWNYIDELKQKNERAIEYVIDNYGPMLYRVVYKILKSKEKSEECLNDVFLKVWINIDLFDAEKGSFKTWITKIASNLALDILKKDTNQKILYFENIDENILEYDLYQQQNIDENDLKKQEYKLLIENIKNLSKIDRYIFINRFFVGKELKDIARELNVTVNSIRVRIHRCRKKLRN